MMLAFVISEEHQYTVRGALESRRHPLLGHVLILSYGDFLRLPQLPCVNYIFLDLERLSGQVRAATAARIAALRTMAPQIRVLNSPSADLSRLAMMRRIRDAGINRARVVPLDDLPEDLSFPVFLRRQDDHGGPVSGLIETMDDLLRETARLVAAGQPREILIVTEYVDTRNAAGHFEKRSYFRIGDKYFPAGLSESTFWVCKGEPTDPNGVDSTEKELHFMQIRDDEPQLIAAFEAAQVSYGRADYMVIDGRVHVFEINTNPMVDTPRKMPRNLHPYANMLLDYWFAALESYAEPKHRGAPAWAAVPVVTCPDEVERPPFLRGLVRKLLIAADILHQETDLRRPFRAIGVLRR